MPSPSSMATRRGNRSVLHRVGMIVLVSVLALVWTPRLSAQTLQGRVLDQSIERPIALAVIRLLARDGAGLGIAVADSAGRYRLSLPSPGEYYVSAERVGYETTRTPLFAVLDPEGVFDVDLSLWPSPLGIPGFEVTADRFEAVDRRLRLLIGRSPSSLRMKPLRRPDIEDHLARSHDLEDLMRWSSIPSLQIRRTNEGPCFLLRPGSAVKVPESCVGVYLNGVPLAFQAVAALPLEIAETILIVLPDESIQYPTGAVLLYTTGWIR